MSANTDLGAIAAAGPVDGWWPVARAAELGTAPVEVRAGNRDWVAFRATPEAAVSVVEARCPHRLVRLAHATNLGGRLQCAYHGWQFGPDGACLLVPSSGPDAAVPARAHLTAPWGVREDAGVLWVAPVDPDAPAADPAADPGGERSAGRPDARAGADTLTNLDASLEHGWHPLALDSEVPARAGLDVRLLGRGYTVTRAVGGGFTVEPRVAAVRERFGVVWAAPRPPRVSLLDSTDDADPQFAQGWLVPDRSSSPAGALAENFLDVAHFPFVHAGTFGAAEEPYVEPFEVTFDHDGLASTQVQWFDNPGDPAVAAGLRPVRQRRRATYTYRWPFQLQLRLEELDAGAVKTILFFLQPQDHDATRIYTKMLLHGIGGVAVPDPSVVADEVAFEVAVLAEDLALQRAMTVPGLPLRLRDELHVRSDRSGVVLRQILTHHRKVDP